MQELDAGADFDATQDSSFFAALPARHAVFTVEARAELPGAQPYLMRTANLRERLQSLLGLPDPASRRLNLRALTGRVRYRVVGSMFEANLLHWRCARLQWPDSYRERLRLRPAAMLKASLRNAYPRCYATRRIGPGGFYFGPFASRHAAELFASGYLDLFKIRRCQIKIRRDPAFPGCIYSEMKMCLAPCFAGCTKAEYDAEVQRVVASLATRGSALNAELHREREAASESLDFERAAAVHRRVEKAADALRGLPEIARPLEDLYAVVLQRSAEASSVAVFVVRAGEIAAPRVLRFAEFAGESRSVEQVLRGWLEPPLEPQLERPLEPPLERTMDHPDDGAAFRAQSAIVQPTIVQTAGAQAAIALPAVVQPTTVQPTGVQPTGVQRYREIEDQVSLLARWYYAKPRLGEIFFREGPAGALPAGALDAAKARRNSEWPYRRILRACSRLLGAETADASGPAAEP